jgi:uncharacterized protein
MKITVEKPDNAKLDKLGVKSWPIWTKEVSVFPWSYDEQEICYILEGQVSVKAGGETVNFGAGDLVTFPEGLSCEWKVIKPVKKHYHFG